MDSRIRATDLAAFGTLRLATLEPGPPAAVLEWDGSMKTLLFEDADRFMLTSSSFDSEKVRRSRQEEYSHVHDGKGLFAFHRSHAPARSAYSPCMHRADAETESFS